MIAGLRSTLAWTETRSGVWRSNCGRYAIIRTVLPDDRPDHTVTFTLRKIDPGIAHIHPGDLGYFRDESYDLEGAQRAAERDAWSAAQGASCNVPEDYPALALARFFWPISEGVTQGALAVCRDGDRTVARIVGMGRHSRDIYEPDIYAEIDLGPVMPRRSFRDALRRIRLRRDR